MERFGKFHLLEVIGHGGMAEVYLAKPADAVLSKLVALKRILPEFSDDPSFREMFQREGSIALAFRHHGIIAVHEMGAVEDQCYMTMEYFPGKTLASIVNQLHSKNEKVDATCVAFIIMRIAEALNYIHDFRDYGGLREIIHRDISPHNIMVGFDGAIKLIDFGIAKDTSLEVTRSRSIKGKIAYMSPEQVRGDSLTKRTDIFSLGIVFWELLAQRKLFSGNTVEEITEKVKACQTPKLEEFATKGSPALFKICERALAENPQARYHTAGEMAADLQEYLRNSGVANYQAQMSSFVRKLFPDDVIQLRGLLRKFEGTQDTASSDYSAFNSTDRGQSIRSSGRRTKGDAWQTVATVLGICACVVLGYALTPKTAPLRAQPTPPPQTLTPPLAPRPQPQDRKPASRTPKSTATTAAPSGFAYVTVRSPPHTKILVNGKYVGHQLAKQIKVPAGRSVEIKTVTSQGATRIKHYKFKAATRNSVVMVD